MLVGMYYRKKEKKKKSKDLIDNILEPMKFERLGWGVVFFIPLLLQMTEMYGMNEKEVQIKFAP